MELKREWMGRSEELRESVMVQMFSTRNEFGRIRKIVRVTLIFEETKQEFFKDYLFEGWKSARHEVTQALSKPKGLATKPASVWSAVFPAGVQSKKNHLTNTKHKANTTKVN